MPDVTGKTTEEAANALIGQGLRYHVAGAGEGKVTAQMPRAGTAVRKDAICVLYTEGTEEEKTMVPDVVGLSISEANAGLANANLNFMLRGTGKLDANGILHAVGQEPAAGTEVPQGTVVQVEFRYTSNE